jgi:hypothetical protein
MPDDLFTRCQVMLHQAHNFARHSPHDAIARIDAMLAELDAAVTRDPSLRAALEPVREQAQAARRGYVTQLDRFRRETEARGEAYTARIHREIGIPDPN